MNNIQKQQQFINGVIISGGEVKTFPNGAMTVCGPGKCGERHVFEIVLRSGLNWDVDMYEVDFLAGSNISNRSVHKFTSKQACYNFILEQIANGVKPDTNILASIVRKYKVSC